MLTPDGNLTTAEKKRILLNNIYGVDIDRNAVEVTKLSLLLKCMEGETQASINTQMTFFHERVLPSLEKNIKSGNSLIDLDFKAGHFDFELEADKKIKPFNWKQNFSEVFRQGGFDAVIGNPPYVLGRETYEDEVKRYISSKYESYTGKFDLYIFFTERGLKLLKSNGRFSFIIPNTILANENAVNLRNFILKNYNLNTIRTFNKRVFENAQVETVIFVISNARQSKNDKIKIESANTQLLSPSVFMNAKDYKFNISVDDNYQELIEKILQQSDRLGDLTDICIGIQLGGSHGESKKEAFISKGQRNKTWKKVLDGKDINTYSLSWNGNFVHYGNWLHRKRDEKYFLNPKLMIRQIGKVPITSYDDEGFYTLNTIYNVINTSKLSLKYFLAIINSRLGRWFWEKENSDFKTLFPKIKKSQIEVIPIRKINIEERSDNKILKEIISLVDSSLSFHKEKQQITSHERQEQLQHRINYTDDKINQLVYQLYGLTEEEIKIVEKNA